MTTKKTRAMTVEELKDFIRRNLVVELSYAEKYQEKNSFRVSLRFEGDVWPFSTDTFTLP